MPVCWQHLPQPQQCEYGYDEVEILIFQRTHKNKMKSHLIAFIIFYTSNLIKYCKTK